jgi:hypothetical protein
VAQETQHRRILQVCAARRSSRLSQIHRLCYRRRPSGRVPPYQLLHDLLYPSRLFAPTAGYVPSPFTGRKDQTCAVRRATRRSNRNPSRLGTITSWERHRRPQVDPVNRGPRHSYRGRTCTCSASLAKAKDGSGRGGRSCSQKAEGGRVDITLGWNICAL